MAPDFTPADDLERHRILTEILDELKVDLKSRMDNTPHLTF